MLKRLFFFSLLIISVIACGDDDNGKVELNYDNDNFSAPLLFPGEYSSSVRFTSNQFNDLVGGSLDEVEFWISDLPINCSLMIYGQGTDTSPGDLLYSESVTLKINGNSWNTINLTDPIELTGDDVWISLRYTIDQNSRIVGCDAGPAVNNGDIFRDETDVWTTLREYSEGSVDINWNIRAFVTPL